METEIKSIISRRTTVEVTAIRNVKCLLTGCVEKTLPDGRVNYQKLASWETGQLSRFICQKWRNISSAMTKCQVEETATLVLIVSPSGINRLGI